MTDTHSGSCLCGTVRFEITGAFESFFLCHCSRCRKNSGAGNAANLFSSTAKIHWQSGEARIKTFRVLDSRHQRSFCADCGSALPNVQGDGALLVVPAGCLDTPLHLRPNAHIHNASRGDWDRDLDAIPGFDGLPE